MNNEQKNTSQFLFGIKQGFPIGIGYFAVSFSLGIAAHHAGLTAFQGFFASLLEIASAGEYAAFTAIAADATYFSLLLATLVANARYFLMSCALSQRTSDSLPLHHRMCMGFFLTDEIFGVTIANTGYVNPYFIYGAATSSVPFWAFGTSLGILMGNVLPLRVVSALSVSLYGMFLAVIIPPAKKNPIIALLVIISFFFSAIATKLPLLSALTESTRIIILTLIISTIAAILCPVSENLTAQATEKTKGTNTHA